MHLGTAFQLIDDALDYDAASSREIGKNIGDDLAEGKPTLPLIHAIRSAPEDKAAIIRKAIEKGGLDNINTILTIIESTNSIMYTRKLAREEADRAIDCLKHLDSNLYRDALTVLAGFAVDRSF